MCSQSKTYLGFKNIFVELLCNWQVILPFNCDVSVQTGSPVVYTLAEINLRTISTHVTQ